MIETLRARLQANQFTVAPGVGDALGARLVEQAGFECVYMSGYCVAATLGYPDVGLATLSEMVFQAARICDTVKVPVIADADNGHGNAINVIRTVRELERAGVSAIHLEDQSLPKKCGHMAGHVLIPTEEMCRKVQAAVEARRRSDFLVFARTDAIGVYGMEDAIGRGKAFRAAGADGVMVQGPRSLDDLKRYRSEVDGPLMVTVGSWNFHTSVDELRAIGYQVALFPLTTLRRSTVAISECLDELKKAGAVDHNASNMISMNELHKVLGTDQIHTWEKRYA
jgi:2-methylisocitrate lyase-like PEP mutase family enzyme